MSWGLLLRSPDYKTHNIRTHVRAESLLTNSIGIYTVYIVVVVVVVVYSRSRNSNGGIGGGGGGDVGARKARGDRDGGVVGNTILEWVISS